MRVELIDGNGPDVYGISTGAAFDTFRLFEEDLTPFCERVWGEDWKEKFLDSCLETVSSTDGRIYGLPLGQTYAGYMWADVNMLRKYGCEVPTNYREMKKTCQTLRENGQMPLAIGAKDSWMNLDMWMSIAADCDKDALFDAIEGKASFEADPIIESFRIWQDCFTSGVFQDKAVKMPIYDTVNDMFQREGSIPHYSGRSSRSYTEGICRDDKISIYGVGSFVFYNKYYLNAIESHISSIINP